MNPRAKGGFAISIGLYLPSFNAIVTNEPFPFESLRILSSPLEIPARLEVCKTLLLTGQTPLAPLEICVEGLLTPQGSLLLTGLASHF